jgi:hypothetical protein
VFCGFYRSAFCHPIGAKLGSMKLKVVRFFPLSTVFLRKFSGNDSTGKDGLRFAPCYHGERVTEFAAPLESEFAFVTYLMPRKIGGKFRFCSVKYRLPDHRKSDKHCLTFPRPN